MFISYGGTTSVVWRPWAPPRPSQEISQLKIIFTKTWSFICLFLSLWWVYNGVFQRQLHVIMWFNGLRLNREADSWEFRGILLSQTLKRFLKQKQCHSFHKIFLSLENSYCSLQKGLFIWNSFIILKSVNT